MVTYKGVDNEVIRLDVDAPQVIFLVLSGAGGPGLLACRGGGGSVRTLTHKNDTPSQLFSLYYYCTIHTPTRARVFTVALLYRMHLRVVTLIGVVEIKLWSRRMTCASPPPRTAFTLVRPRTSCAQLDFIYPGCTLYDLQASRTTPSFPSSLISTGCSLSW
jgi:hypothetical protein